MARPRPSAEPAPLGAQVLRQGKALPPPQPPVEVEPPPPLRSPPPRSERAQQVALEIARLADSEQHRVVAPGAAPLDDLHLAPRVHGGRVEDLLEVLLADVERAAGADE